MTLFFFSEYFSLLSISIQILLFSMIFTSKDDIVFFRYTTSETQIALYLSYREQHKEFGTKGSARIGIGTSEQVIESRYFVLCSAGCCSCIHRSHCSVQHRNVSVSAPSITNYLFPYIVSRKS